MGWELWDWTSFEEIICKFPMGFQSWSKWPICGIADLCVKKFSSCRWGNEWRWRYKFVNKKAKKWESTVLTVILISWKMWTFWLMETGLRSIQSFLISDIELFNKPLLLWEQTNIRRRRKKFVVNTKKIEIKSFLKNTEILFHGILHRFPP